MTVAGCLLLTASLAQGADARPAMLREVGIEQRLGQQLPLDALFSDELGRPVRLGQYFGRRPVILVLAYYNCPMLCTQVFNGLVSSLRVVGFDAGKEFDVVAVSFDPRDRPADAAAKKKAYVDEYRRPGAALGWHFLTGGSGSIERVTRSAGFRYRYDESTGQFAHSTAIYVATPEGKLSRYFYGIEYGPRDLRLALVEASSNRIGSPVDQILLYCYHYDPKLARYSAAIMSVVRLGGVGAVIILSTFLTIMWRRDRRRDRPHPGGEGGGPGRGARSLPSGAREEARAAGAERGARDQASDRASLRSQREESPRGEEPRAAGARVSEGPGERSSQHPGEPLAGAPAGPERTEATDRGRIRPSRSPVRPQGAGPSRSAERRN